MTTELSPDQLALKAATRMQMQIAGGCPAAARFCRVGKSSLDRYGSIHEPTDFIPLDVAAAVMKESDDYTLLRELARICGKDIVDADASDEDADDLEEAQLELWQMGAEITEVISEARKSRWSPRLLQKAAGLYHKWSDKLHARKGRLFRTLSKSTVVALRKENG